jgi:hypothetical protein
MTWKDENRKNWDWLPKPIPGVDDITRRVMKAHYTYFGGIAHLREQHPVTGQPFPWREQDMKLKLVEME